MRRISIIFLVLAIITTVWVYQEQVASTNSLLKDGATVISLGQDLTEEQKNQVIRNFKTKVNLDQVQYVSVSNKEERKYLQGKIDEKIIGSRAISCALVMGLSKGQGIEVHTHNINGVSPFMYANAANTAGIQDVQILVEAPFEVSGTAALTGIIKAFEAASGNSLNETAKEAANDEIAESSKLGDKIGQDKAGRIIYEVKKQVVEKKVADPDEIRKIVIQISTDLNITLSEDDINRIVALMQKINQVNINISQLNQQLDKLQKGLDNVRTQTDQAQNFFQRLARLIRNLLQGITGMTA
ncbi:MAG: DUF1002 domain-containing protein [Syntrophomonas sp.]|nr:DUF1002 domain-containing protein [Syntrophomonas sp.]